MTETILTNKKHGMLVLLLTLALYVLAVIGTILFAVEAMVAPMVVCIVYLCLGWIFFLGLKVLAPQEALVLTLFGKYVGTLKGEGFYYVNPFCVAVNPAAKTQMNQSPDIESAKGIAVTWRVVDTVKAVFDVDNYKEFLSLQCDGALRNIVRLYPYDIAPGAEATGDVHPDEESLRGSSEVVAARIREELQSKVQEAGLEILQVRITHLAYASEIAAAMLQRQQASAIIDARKMIVEGAVGTVEMALERLNQSGVVELDEERKAAMVSNLLVVLCGNHEAQPVVNTGSLY